MFGDQIPNLIGFEYYKGGFFEVIEDKKPTTVRLRTTSQIVSDFDWRNRHGKDWTTATQQQNGGTCWAYATIGAVEALVNLYFNNENIDLDLSEQDIIACSGGGDCDGGTPAGTLDYLTYSGVVDQDCFLDNNCSQSCISKCQYPTESIRIGGGGFTNYGPEDTETEIKKMIISKGVLCGSMLSWDHYMALTGYGTVRIGDEIRTDTTGIYIIKTIVAGDSLIGKTYWIFKNSWGSWGIDGTGYCYVVTNSSELLATTMLETPLVRANHTNAEIISEDKDGDGYYNWGIGNRPISCPQCALTEKDGDDSDPYFGPMDAYGNLQPAMPNYTYPPTIISSNRTYYADVRLCGDLIVESNSTLDIVGTLHFPPNSQIIVNNGGKIVVKDNGIIKNTNLIVHPGGSVLLQSNAVLEMGFNDEINIEVGATFDFINGEIRKIN